MPILLADPKRRAVAAVHAGWRGALEGVIRKAVEEMRRALGSHPPDLVAAVGPFIHACCYEVGEEVVEVFHRRFPEAQGFFRGMPELDRRKCYLDLGRVARDELLHTGVSPSNILITDFCTSCRTDLFFSHRKEQGRTGRMMAIIGIRKQSYTERHKL